MRVTFPVLETGREGRAQLTVKPPGRPQGRWEGRRSKGRWEEQGEMGGAREGRSKGKWEEQVVGEEQGRGGARAGEGERDRGGARGRSRGPPPEGREGKPVIQLSPYTRQHIKQQRHHFADRGPYSQSYSFSSSHAWMSVSCWRRLLRVPWTARSSNQSSLKEINPEYSLEGLMLKLKLQYFDPLM